MFGHLKINRAIATRYDQLANSFLGMVHFATARYWLKFVYAAYRSGGFGTQAATSGNRVFLKARLVCRLGMDDRFR